MKKPLTLTTTLVEGIPTAHVIRDADGWAVGRVYPSTYGRECGEELVRAYNMHDDLVAVLERVANVADTAASILHKSCPEEAELFREDSKLVRAVLRKARGE
jgi:hypothetical protein